MGSARRLLSFRHTSQNDRILRRMPKIPRCLKRTPDIWVFRAAVESNQLHAMRTLHLVTLTESCCPFAEGLFALETQNFNSVGHENFLRALSSFCTALVHAAASNAKV